MNNEQSFLTLDLLLVTNLVLENFDIAIITLNALILHYTSICQSRFFGQNLVVIKTSLKKSPSVFTSCSYHILTLIILLPTHIFVLCQLT